MLSKQEMCFLMLFYIVDCHWHEIITFPLILDSRLYTLEFLFSPKSLAFANPGLYNHAKNVMEQFLNSYIT